MGSMEHMENIEHIDLYKKNLEYSNKNILENFLNLIKIYNKIILQNDIFKNEKNENNENNENNEKSFSRIFYNRGLNAIMIIFMKILKRTNNLELTYYHCEKSIYYYNEFFSQITNKNNFINVSCNDAVMFLYKKSIYRLSRFNINEDDEYLNKFNQISICLKIIILMLKNNSNNTNTNTNTSTNTSNNNMSIEEVKSELPGLLSKSLPDLEEVLNGYF